MRLLPWPVTFTWSIKLGCSGLSLSTPGLGLCSSHHNNGLHTLSQVLGSQRDVLTVHTSTCRVLIVTLTSSHNPFQRGPDTENRRDRTISNTMEQLRNGRQPFQACHRSAVCGKDFPASLKPHSIGSPFLLPCQTSLMLLISEATEPQFP